MLSFEPKRLWLQPWLAPASFAAGSLGLVVSRAGVGKTAFLVQLALDELFLGRDVLHVSLAKALSQVEGRYDLLLRVRLEEAAAPERESLRLQVARRRAIQALATSRLGDVHLEQILSTFCQHLKLQPSLVVIDGTEDEPQPQQAEELKRLARRRGLAVWLSLRLEKDACPFALFDRLRPAVDAAVLLRQSGPAVEASLLLAENAGGPPPLLRLEAELMRPENLPHGQVYRPSDFTLLSGAAVGAEAAFGEMAEKYGLEERNFSFAGRECARRRGLVLLSDDELLLGDVSFAYLSSRTGRSFESGEYMRRVLQSIWHQVNPAGEVFCIGEVLPARSVKGGTGWAVELAKKQLKPVWVFDQKLECWYEWFENDWRLCDAPRIRHFRFCGTGTRRLLPAGRAAVEELFRRSFG